MGVLVAFTSLASCIAVSGVRPPEPTITTGLLAAFHSLITSDVAFGDGPGGTGKGDFIEPQAILL